MSVYQEVEGVVSVEFETKEEAAQFLKAFQTIDFEAYYFNKLEKIFESNRNYFKEKETHIFENYKNAKIPKPNAFELLRQELYAIYQREHLVRKTLLESSNKDILNQIQVFRDLKESVPPNQDNTIIDLEFLHEFPVSLEGSYYPATQTEPEEYPTVEGLVEEEDILTDLKELVNYLGLKDFNLESDLSIESEERIFEKFEQEEEDRAYDGDY